MPLPLGPRLDVVVVHLGGVAQDETGDHEDAANDHERDENDIIQDTFASKNCPDTPYNRQGQNMREVERIRPVAEQGEQFGKTYFLVFF